MHPSLQGRPVFLVVAVGGSEVVAMDLCLMKMVFEGRALVAMGLCLVKLVVGERAIGVPRSQVSEAAVEAGMGATYRIGLGGSRRSAGREKKRRITAGMALN